MGCPGRGPGGEEGDEGEVDVVENQQDDAHQQDLEQGRDDVDEAGAAITVFWPILSADSVTWFLIAARS